MSGQPLWWEEVHGRTDYPFPQLEMVRPDLEDLAPVELPAGYTIRSFRPGDEDAWAAIMSEAFNPYWDAVRFRRLMLPHFGFRPERVLFLCYGERPVGSASAFLWPGLDRRCGYIHMLGVQREHCGHGLGKPLAAACLRVFHKGPFTHARLQTEEYRIPAIKHYLDLGFRPVLVREDQRQKWITILDRIERPHLIETFQIRTLPVMSGTALWWRTVRVMTYVTWLDLRWALYGGMRRR